MQTTGLVGRDDELTRLEEVLARVPETGGTVIGVAGEPGMGKSCVVSEAATRARDRGYQVMEGSASAVGMMYGAIDDLLRQALDVPVDTPEQQVRERVRTASDELGLTATDGSHLAALLGVSPDGSGWSQLDARARSVNNRIALQSFLRARAHRAPQLVVLDEMHWADELTRDAVAALALQEQPVAVVLLYWPGFTLPPAAEEMALGSMSDATISSLLSRAVGSVPPDLDSLLRFRAEGNPLYIEEAVRLLLETGALVGRGETAEVVRSIDSKDLPAGLAGVLRARLHHLPPDALRAAQLAAVVGRSFTASLLVSAAGDDAMVTGLEELEARGFVAFRRRGSKREYRFRHALTGDVAYASLDEDLRSNLHRRVAEALEGLEEESGRYRSGLGHHWEQVGEYTKARRCFRNAARRAVAWNAPAEAENLYRRQLALDPPDVEAVETRLEMASDATRALGRHHDALDLLGVVVDQAREMKAADLEARGLVAQAEVLGDLGSLAEALTRLEDAIEVARGADANRERAEALRTSAILLHRLGRLDESRARCVEELDLRRQSGDRHSEAMALSNLAVAAKEQGKFREALELNGDALRINQELGRRQGEGMVLANMAVIRMEQGQLNEARSLYEQALVIHREVGDRRFEGMTLGNLGNLHRVLGSPLPEVRVIYEQALALHRQVRDRVEQGRVLSNLAGLYDEHGESDRAVPLFEEALAIHREVGNRRSEGIVLENLGKLRLSRGEVAQARSHFNDALAIVREVGDRRIVGHLLLDRAQLERRVGSDLGRAEALLREAETTLTEVGDRPGVLECWCERGLVELASGRSAGPQLARAREMARELDVPLESTSNALIARLQRSVDGSRRGRRLYRGELEDELPGGLHRWLVDHHRLDPPRTESE